MTPKSSLKNMDRATVARQIVLPWKKSLYMAFQGLRVRFFRSMLTILSLALAVAFLAFVLINANLAQGLLDSGIEEAASTLTEAGYEIDQNETTVTTGAKDRWIVLLSLLVCAVGIVNAQLMSVMERFREIGIMKCLGALDSIVLRLFLLEAAMQGAAGAAMGAVIGFFVSLSTCAIRFGLDGITALPTLAVLQSLGIAIAAGIGLSLISVLYPAILAARMRPIMAMRQEY